MARRGVDETPDGGFQLLVRGGIYGLAAAIVGFVLTYVVESGSLERAGTELFRMSARGQTEMLTVGDLEGIAASSGGLALDTLNLVTWVFHSLHQTSVTMDLPGGRTATTEFVAGGGILLAVPPVVLAGAGFLVARHCDATDAAGGLLYGGTVAVGYLPMAVATAAVSTWSVSGAQGTLSVSVPLAETALFTGLGYPLVFGAAGGLFGTLLSGSGVSPPADAGAQPQQGRGSRQNARGAGTGQSPGTHAGQGQTQNSRRARPAEGGNGPPAGGRGAQSPASGQQPSPPADSRQGRDPQSPSGAPARRNPGGGQSGSQPRSGTAGDPQSTQQGGADNRTQPGREAAGTARPGAGSTGSESADETGPSPEALAERVEDHLESEGWRTDRSRLTVDVTEIAAFDPEESDRRLIHLVTDTAPVTADRVETLRSRVEELDATESALITQEGYRQAALDRAEEYGVETITL